MRAREFICEQKELPPETAEPMQYTYTLPGLSAADPYKSYRMGVALARARSEYRKDNVNPHMPEWSAETAFGEHAVISGMNSGIEQIIDAALAMTDTPGGKRLVSTPESNEPKFVTTQSPVNAFKGYPR
jgi:hypothetical protein